MRPDSADGLRRAAKHRTEQTRTKAIDALRQLDQARETVTFEAVARAAGISRSWLYNQPDLRAEIQRLRDAARPVPGSAVPARQRASGASLLARLQVSMDKNRKLAEENQRLRDQLARALGDERMATRGEGSPPATVAIP